MLSILDNSKGLVALGRPSHARVFESRGPGLRIGCYGHETRVAVTNVHNICRAEPSMHMVMIAVA
jgi:hypothetical protein